MLSPSFLARSLALAVALLMAYAPLEAQEAAEAPKSASFTADELYLNALQKFNAGDHKAAVVGFQTFQRDFGTAQQAKGALAAIRYPYALSLVHLQKFSEALAAINVALDTEPKLDPNQRQELLFWRGVCLMQEEDYAAARESMAAFVQEFPTAAKTPEALLLAGTTFILDGKHAEAARHFAEIKHRLNTEDRGRATVLQLYALLEADDKDAALALVVDEFPRMGDIVQIATFQTLALQLGSSFLEAERYRDAILCLQRVWSSDRLIKHQRTRLENLEDALKAAEALPKGDVYQKFHLKQMIAKIQRELDNFSKIENFDAALRLRLATAYMGMQRYREAALILEEMLARMPANPVVESASVSLVQAWSQVENWAGVVSAAKIFEEKFPKSPQLPLVLYVAGTAQQRANDQPAAIATFDSIVQRFPKSDFAPRALFMVGFSQLLAEQNKAAIETFSEFAKRYPDHELREPAAYWYGMGFSLDKQYEPAREAMDAYLSKYPKGTYAGLAVFRKAYAAQSLMDYTQSIQELNDYLAKYPGHESNDEALLLLGDALMNEGQIDEGIAAYNRISPENTRFFEEAWFKTGKALRLMERPDEMRAHFEQFQREHARSPRVAEAVYWIGWTHRQAGKPEEARNVYWEAITTLGNDPTIRSVEDLFPALSKLYKGPEEQRQYLTRLADLRESAIAENQSTLAMRALWARGQALARSNPSEARELMVEAGKSVDVPNTNPLVLADIAQALQDTGRLNEAAAMWRDLIKWNPRAAQKDRAFAALAKLELDNGKQKAALAWIDRFDKETSGSILAAGMYLTKGHLLTDRGDIPAARVAFEAVLTAPAASGQQKAEALYSLGESFMATNQPELAIPYFQRIYIMHGRWSDWVARAYYRSGEAFEAMKNTDAARKTYQEMSQLENIRDTPEADKGRSRLEALGGPIKES